MHPSIPLPGTGKPVPQHIVDDLPEYCKPFNQHEWMNHKYGFLRPWELPPLKTDKGIGCAKFIPRCHTPRTFIPESGIDEHLTVQQHRFDDLPRTCRHSSHAESIDPSLRLGVHPEDFKPDPAFLEASIKPSEREEITNTRVEVIAYGVPTI